MSVNACSCQGLHLSLMCMCMRLCKQLAAGGCCVDWLGYTAACVCVQCTRAGLKRQQCKRLDSSSCQASSSSHKARWVDRPSALCLVCLQHMQQ